MVRVTINLSIHVVRPRKEQASDHHRPSSEPGALRFLPMNSAEEDDIYFCCAPGPMLSIAAIDLRRNGLHGFAEVAYIEAAGQHLARNHRKVLVWGLLPSDQGTTSIFTPQLGHSTRRIA